VTPSGRIVVAGAFADVAEQAGASWAVLQYVLGLRDLGHDVWVLEPVEHLTASTRGYFERLVSEFDLRDRAALLVGTDRTTVGASYTAVREACASADALLNLSGLLRDPDLLERLRVRAYLDLDPAFNQLWHASGIDRGFALHTHHLTLGAALGTPGCEVPTCGIGWTPTLPPVVLDQWPARPSPSRGALSTVANWRSYGSIEAGGVRYGQKAHSLRELIELPRRCEERFVLALSIDPAERADLGALREHGWELQDPRRVAATTTDYRGFIAASKAELGIAKAGYVSSRCGWFSDRSACYLATGRPVLAQDTGFGVALPVGEGLLAFDSRETAAAAIEELEGDYPRHARAARTLAEDHLDARLVLGRLLERIGCG
jgi:hypothetical protein